MGTLIFDFDSTLISVESLEVILEKKLTDAPHLYEKIKAITDQGMAGTISFRESLARRLAIAAPSLEDIHAFTQKADQWLTPGVAELIAAYAKRGHTIRVVSGGLREAIVPVVSRLGVTPDRVHAVALGWSSEGAFQGINPTDLFSESKCAGVKPLHTNWPSPRIAVGDGMTDFALYQQGLVDHFIAYTQHVRRPAVVETGSPEAQSPLELTKILENLL